VLSVLVEAVFPLVAHPELHLLYCAITVPVEPCLRLHVICCAAAVTVAVVAPAVPLRSHTCCKAVTDSLNTTVKFSGSVVGSDWPDAWFMVMMAACIREVVGNSVISAVEAVFPLVAAS